MPRIMSRLSLVVILIGITYLSLTPSTLVSLGSDKVGHFIAYGILMINLGVLRAPEKSQLRIRSFFRTLLWCFDGNRPAIHTGKKHVYQRYVCQCRRRIHGCNRCMVYLQTH